MHAGSFRNRLQLSLHADPNPLLAIACPPRLPHSPSPPSSPLCFPSSAVLGFFQGLWWCLLATKPWRLVFLLRLRCVCRNCIKALKAFIDLLFCSSFALLPGFSLPSGSSFGWPGCRGILLALEEKAGWSSDQPSECCKRTEGAAPPAQRWRGRWGLLQSCSHLYTARCPLPCPSILLTLPPVKIPSEKGQRAPAGLGGPRRGVLHSHSLSWDSDSFETVPGDAGTSNLDFFLYP